jgi:hypothetical protein
MVIDQDQLLKAMLLSVLTIHAPEDFGSFWAESGMNVLRKGLKPRSLNPYEPFGPVLPPWDSPAYRQGG